MRFESLLWSALVMLLTVGAGWSGDSLVGPSGSGDYQAADGGSTVPPPIMDPGTNVPSSLDGGSTVPPPRP